MVEQLPNAQALARNPVDVRWSDSTSDRADGGIAASSLFGLIADDLVRQYQVRTVADSQVLRSSSFSLVSFNSTSGSTTTPLPITFIVCGQHIPDGTR